MHIDLKEINRLELFRMGILPQHIEKTDTLHITKIPICFSRHAARVCIVAECFVALC